MSHLQYFDYPDFGTRARRDIHSSQAVRVNDFIEISGQGGWDPKTEKFPTSLSDEIDQAFSNVQLALQTAGGKGWEGVYKIRVFVSLRDRSSDTWKEYAEHVIGNLKKWCPNHGPAMTLVEVKALWQDMRIEIEATEHVV